MTSINTILISACLGAAAGTVAAIFVSPSNETAPTDTDLSSGGTSLTFRISQLEQENSALRMRLDLLEDRPGPVQRINDNPSREEFDALLARLGEGMGESESISTGPTGPGFDGAVTAVIEQREQAARDEKQQAAAERREEGVRKATDYWTETLQLDQHQSEQLHELMLARAEGQAQLKTDWQAGVDTALLGETKASIQTNFDAGLATVLTPSQLETYRASTSRGSKE